MIAVLLGLVIFLLLLIAVVLAARKFRPVAGALRSRAPAQSLKPLVERLERAPTREKRADAAREIARQGPEAVIAALDATTAVSLSDNSLRIPRSVVQAFADLGTDIVPALLKAVAVPKENVRTSAVDILREMGPAAHPAVSTLAALVNDNNRWIRGFACDSLGNLGPKSQPAVEALMGVVDHEDPYTRRRAIVALGRIGPAARAAVPVLRRAQQREWAEDVREAATVALHEINLEGLISEAASRANPEVRELIRRLQEKDEYEAVAAARTLARRGSDAKAAVPALALALAHSSKWVREAAAEALGAIGPEAKSVAPALQRAAKDKEAEVREAAQKALSTLGL